MFTSVDTGANDSSLKRPAQPSEFATSSYTDMSNNESVPVTWDSPFDTENPLCWSTKRKWINVVLVSIQGTFTPLASTLPSIAAPELARYFHTASTLTPTLPVALFVLGLGLGPLYLAPLSEVYGRRPVYLFSYGIFAVINIGCALAPSLAALSVLRLFSGMAGSAGPSLGGASIGDMFSKKDRGKAQSLYGFGPTGGPILGGVLGGFILNGTGSWRWLFWITAVAPAASTALNFLLLKESYGPVLLRKRAQTMQKARPDTKFVTDLDNVRTTRLLLSSLTRPLRLLTTNPICSVLAFYAALVYGILYLHLMSLSLLFAPTPFYAIFSYEWQHGLTGLSFLGVGTGIILGTILSAKFSNWSYAWMNAWRTAKRTIDPSSEISQQHPESLQPQSRPESRLLFLQIGMTLIPLGLVLFAWTAGRTHWIAPLIGASIFGCGMILAYVAFQVYIVDVFGKFAASALATAVILRSVLGCVLTLVGFKLYESLGYAWGTMLLAFVCIAMLPLPILLYVLGPRLRKNVVP